MDCSTCRSFFSQSFDDRLAGERRQEFAIHLHACAVCDSEFALYRRVFSTIRGLPEDGEVKPFQTPAEVPGALSVLQGPGSTRPRFARAAAAVLVLLGLAGTHVLVFQWSRDHASTPSEKHVPPSDGGIMPATTAASLTSALPAALRDHVEATDLFIKTQERLPDDPSAPDVVAADWAVSNIPALTDKLTEEMRLHPYEIAPEDRALVHRYLQAAREDFVPAIQEAMASGTPRSMTEFRKTVSQRRLLRDLKDMKMLTATLPRGTSYARQAAMPAVERLSADGRRLIESKQLRLSGQFSRAIDGFNGFKNDFPKSQLQPAALYLQFEALNAAGRPGDALTVVITYQSCGGKVAGSLDRVFQFIQPPQVRVSWDEVPAHNAYILKVVRGEFPNFPMKSEGLRHLAEDGLQFWMTSGNALAPVATPAESRPSRK